MLAEVGAGVEPLLSCSLTGIIRATLGVRGAVPLIHGPMSCASGHRPIPLQAGQEPLVPPTTLTDIDLVRGTGDKLEESIVKLHDVYRPKLIVVILTCATSLVSEYHDVKLQSLSQEMGCMILAVDGSAMAGDEVEGYRLFTHALESALGGSGPPSRPASDGIYLRGLSPTDYAIDGQIDTLTSLIERGLDCPVQGTFLRDFDLENDMGWLQCPGLPVGWLWAEDGEWVPAPYGLAGTKRWLANSGSMLGHKIDLDRIHSLTRAESDMLADIRHTGRLNEMRVAIEGLSWWAIGLGRFLREELGCTVLISTDPSVLDYERSFGPVADLSLIDVGNYELLTYLDDFQPHVVFGSSYVSSGPWHWVPFYQPVWHPAEDIPDWMGPEGALKLAAMLAEVNGLYA
jgi:nitrogenase molybdenum-iron protein alpha/beta subunit